MTSTYTESESTLAPAAPAAYGGLADAIAGIATIVLAIIALGGVHPETILPIAVIVFAATLLIQGGTVLSEYEEAAVSTVGMASASPERFHVAGLSTLFLVGVTGIVMGILALLGIAAETLTAISVIAFGSALLLSANSLRDLSFLQTSSSRSATPRTGAELLSGEIASASAGVRTPAGLAVIVLGVVALVVNQNILTLAALIVLGATVILTGSAPTGLVNGFMRATTPSRWAEGIRSAGEPAAKSFLGSIYQCYVGKSSAGAAGIRFTNAQSVRNYFTSALASLILDDRAAATRRGESPALEGDPFIGRKDWDISDLSIDVNDTDGPRTVGTVTFMNFGKPQRIVLELLRSGKEWRIADVEWDSGTLRGLYRRAGDLGRVRKCTGDSFTISTAAHRRGHGPQW